MHDSNRLVPEGEILARPDRAMDRMRIGGADERHRGLDDRVAGPGFGTGLSMNPTRSIAFITKVFIGASLVYFARLGHLHRNLPDLDALERDRQFENSVAIGRADILLFYTFWDRDRTLKISVSDLAMNEVVLALLARGAARTTDRQDAAIDPDLRHPWVRPPEGRRAR